MKTFTNPDVMMTIKIPTQRTPWLIHYSCKLTVFFCFGILPLLLVSFGPALPWLLLETASASRTNCGRPGGWRS
jgi:hypothetical protein